MSVPVFFYRKKSKKKKTKKSRKESSDSSSEDSDDEAFQGEDLWIERSSRFFKLGLKLLHAL